MSTKPKHLLFSLKPCYADFVFEGRKGAELRRRRIPENSYVFLYISSPVRQIRGGFRVGQVWRGTPEEIWDQVSELAKMDKSDFDAYYTGRTLACALEITDVWEYEKPVSLNILRKRFPNFVVPQSWRHLQPEEHKFIVNRRKS